MKSFSNWLALQGDLRSKLDAAIAYYKSPLDGKLADARGAQRMAYKEIIENLGNLWLRALFTYKAEVVDRTYAALNSPAAKRALTVEWDRLLHNNGHLSFQDLPAAIQNLDKFAKRYRLTKGDFVLWEDYAQTSPGAGNDGFIPVIGEGFSSSYKMDQGNCIRYSGQIELEAKSLEEFSDGAPGSAWIGLLSIAERTGRPRHTLFLYPALHMEKHVTAPHDYERRGISKPVEQWKSAGHAEAIVALLLSGRMNLGRCNGCLAPGNKLDAKEAAGYGCVMGFAMVKAYNAVGHQWAFTSQSCNVPATGVWVVKDGISQQAGSHTGQMQLPTEWAIAIWNVTKKMPGNTEMHPGAPNRNWDIQEAPSAAAAAAAAGGPKLPPKPIPKKLDGTRGGGATLSSITGPRQLNKTGKDLN